MLLYDRQTDSLWSQLGGKAVAGPLAGTTLNLLPSTETTWDEWERGHPGTLVLSFNTGYKRNYSRDPYENFPLDRRLALVVKMGNQVKIYPFSELKKAKSPIVDQIAGMQISIEFNERNQTAAAHGVNGKGIPHFISFLPDARAFYPDAPIFKSK